MRWGLAQAVHHARHRSAFGKLLAEQPLMRNVLADLAIESEAATAVTMRVARAYDEGDAPFRRIATAVMKHWVCKRAPGHANEALECLGGNGYVEESGMPRLLRDSPLNSIWEGSGNVSALDVLRALAKEPEALPAFLAECELARGGNAALDAQLDRLAERAAAGPRVRGPARGLGPRGGAPGEPAGPQRARAGGGRLLRLATRRRPARRLRHAAAVGATPRRSWTARWPPDVVRAAHPSPRGERPARGRGRSSPSGPHFAWPDSGRLEHALEHPALVAERDGALVGVLTFVLGDDDCEILTLHASERFAGRARALIEAVERLAADAGCDRLWVITTNDNTDALRFYQRRGFRLAALHRGAVDDSRRAG